MRRILSLLIGFMLVIIPFRGVGSSEVGVYSSNPSDYESIGSGWMVDTLVDSLSVKQVITYQWLSSRIDPAELLVSLLVESDEANKKDRYITVEAFENVGGTLQLIQRDEFNTEGSKSRKISAFYSKKRLKDVETLYLRLGVSSVSGASHFSDETLFKIDIPPSAVAVADKPVYEKLEGNFALLHNESVDGYTFEEIGDLAGYQKAGHAVHNEAYQIDVSIPFDPKDQQLVQGVYHKAADELGSERTFSVLNYSTKYDEEITAKLLYNGSKAQVWVHEQELSVEQAMAIGKEFDQKIYPSVTMNFGKEPDVNRDGKVKLLFFDIKDDFNGSGPYIGGYFRANDLYKNDFSNQSELLYMDTYPSLAKDFTKAYSTLAHELQHLVNYNQNVLVEGGNYMDTWLDEGLSMAAEQVYLGVALDRRIDYYNQSDSIANGHSLLYWDNEDILSNYSLSYLFVQYVKLQMRKGNSIFREILLDKNNDYEAIENVVKKYVDRGLTFGKFMTHFREALILKENSGLKGFYGDEIGEKVQTRVYKDQPASLRGGGAVVVKINPDEGFMPPPLSGELMFSLLSVNGISNDQIPIITLTVDRVLDVDEVVTGKGFMHGTVTVKVDGEVIGSDSTGSDRSFRVLIPKQKKGTELEIEARDASGSRTNILVVKVSDGVSPKEPELSPVNDNDSYLVGKAAPGSYKVIAKLDGEELTWSYVNSAGEFSLFLNLLPAGTILTVYVEDLDGDVSHEVSVVVGKAPPAKPVVGVVGDNQVVVTGKAGPGVTVVVLAGGKKLGEAVANSKGDFSVKIGAKQKAGTVLTVHSLDRQGRKSGNVTIKVLDKTAPALPVVNSLTGKSTSISGKAEAGATVYVYVGNKLVVKIVVDKKGNFKSKISGLKKNMKLSVYAVDKSGNKSKRSVVVVK